MKLCKKCSIYGDTVPWAHCHHEEEANYCEICQWLDGNDVTNRSVYVKVENFAGMAKYCPECGRKL